VGVVGSVADIVDYYKALRPCMPCLFLQRAMPLFPPLCYIRLSAPSVATHRTRCKRDCLSLIQTRTGIGNLSHKREREHEHVVVRASYYAISGSMAQTVNDQQAQAMKIRDEFGMGGEAQARQRIRDDQTKSNLGRQGGSAQTTNREAQARPEDQWGRRTDD
jgi:hypothetical protein